MAMDSRNGGRTSSALTIEIQTTACKIGPNSAKDLLQPKMATVKGLPKGGLLPKAERNIY